MGKKSKRATKEKKALSKGVKKKQRLRKLGLAKYVQAQSKPNKREPKEVDDNLDTETMMDLDTPSVKTVKIDKKNLSLVDRCKLQMSSSILRLVDEDIYTSDSKNIPLDKEKFIAYHEAYASVSDKWPTKPVDYIIRYIKKRMLTMKANNKLKFADIGCGRNPLLKIKLPPRCKVQSFDLVSTHEDIIEANMEKLPLQDDSINCAVYSLSLMAKNLGNILLEGKRVLKVGGSMLIVEVTSRFEGNEKRFISKLDKIGLKKKSTTILKPNGYFTFFHFIKIDSKKDYPRSALDIQLKPCVYKSR